MHIKNAFLMAAVLIAVSSAPLLSQYTWDKRMEELKRNEERDKLEEEKLKTNPPEIILGVFLNDEDITFKKPYEFCIYAEKKKLTPKSTRTNRLIFERADGHKTVLLSYGKHVAVFNNTKPDVLDTGATILFQILTKPSLLKQEKLLGAQPFDENYERIMNYHDARWILREQWLLLPESVKSRIKTAYALSVTPKIYGDGTICVTVWFD
jgi:hypothetical protein